MARVKVQVVNEICKRIFKAAERVFKETQSERKDTVHK